MAASVCECYHTVQPRVRRAAEIRTGLLEIDWSRFERSERALTNFRHTDGGVNEERIGADRNLGWKRFFESVESKLPAKFIDSDTANCDFVS